MAWLRRRERIESLALDPAAYAIPEVAGFGARAAGLDERQRLASWMASLVRPTDHPLELHLASTR